MQHTLPALILLAGCGGETRLQAVDDGGDPPVRPVPYTERLLAAVEPELDVLWVIDDSGSMADEQEALAEAFPVFASQLADAGLSWHVGVITTDRFAEDAGELRSVDGLRVLTPDTPDLQRRFAELARVGTDGAHSEQPLGTTWLALELKRDEQGGFYRPEAALDVIVVSDEDDSTPEELFDLQGFVDWFAGLKVQRDERRLSAVVPAEAERTIAVSDAVGGVVHDLRGDFSGTVEDLGLRAAAPKVDWYLSRPPVPGSLDVGWERSGKPVPVEGTWTLDLDAARVRFEVAPPPGTVVVLGYLVHPE